MKKYRQTKITVRTRETILFTKNAVGGTAANFENTVCPLCHSPVLPMNGNAALLMTEYNEEEAAKTSAENAPEHACPQQ